MNTRERAQYVYGLFDEAYDRWKHSLRHEEKYCWMTLTRANYTLIHAVSVLMDEENLEWTEALQVCKGAPNA